MPDLLFALPAALLLLLQEIPTETQYASGIWENIVVMLLAVAAIAVRFMIRGDWGFSRSAAVWSNNPRWSRRDGPGELLADFQQPAPVRSAAATLSTQAMLRQSDPAQQAALAYQAQLNAWLGERGMSPADPSHLAAAMQAIPYDPARFNPAQQAPLQSFEALSQPWLPPSTAGAGIGSEVPSNIALAFGLAAPPPRSTGTGPALSPPQQVQELLWMFSEPWWIAGGWAIELWLGRSLRSHSDIEVAIPRTAQLALRDYLSQFRFTQLVKDADGQRGEQPLPAGELAAPEVHELHVRRYSGAGLDPLALLRFEVLLNEIEDGRWCYRRDKRVSLPLERLGVLSSSGLPCLAPEVVLLYKAGSSTGLRAVDEEDFAAALAQLEPQPREWLRAALELAHPGHAWLTRL